MGDVYIMKEWVDDLRVAVSFLTRVPISHSDGVVNFQRAMRLFPVVGGAIGLVVGLVQLGLLRLGLPPLAAAALTLGASALLTGALHEDGLGDTADGFGGGRDIPAKLEIMRDSRLGTYGTLALLISFAAKLAALAALPSAMVVPGLIAAHALARSILPGMATLMPQARNDGLAVTAGRPDQAIAITAAGLGVVIALICLPWGTAFAAIVLTMAGAAGMGWLAQRQVGGHTGDVLGGTEQVCETLILLLLAARPA
jgi:adenosylcobinamide-GDP ribazoletransferase